MKMQFKGLSLLLCGAMMVSMFAGCSSSTPASSSKPESSVTESSKEDASTEVSSAEETSETEKENSAEESSVQASEGDKSEESSKADPSEESSEITKFEYDYSKGLNEQGFFIDVKASDYVTLPDFAKLELPYEIYTASDAELAAEVVKVLNSFTTTEKITDAVVKDGDSVNIDYVGSVDGVEFVGGNTQGTGTTVTIGVTSYIDDFLEQLIGHKPGETFNVEVTFPDYYPQSVELQGKDAIFVTTINYIEKKVVPELTDEFVKENLEKAYGWTTTQELKDYLSNSIVDNKIDSFVTEYLTSNSTVSSIPDVVKTYQEDAMLEYYYEYAVQYGMGLDQFFKTVMRSSREDVMKNNSATMEKLEKQDLIIQAVAEKAGLEVTEETLKAFFLENMHSEDYSSFETQWGLPYLKKLILNYTVNDYLAANATRLEKDAQQ